MRAARDLEEATLRAQRAADYAQKFPLHSRPDSIYCTVEWQLEQLSKYPERSALEKAEKKKKD